MNIFESTFEKHKKLMLESVVGEFEFDDPQGPMGSLPGDHPINVGRRQHTADHRMALQKINALLSSGLKIVPLPVSAMKGKKYPVVSNGGRKIVLVDMGTIKLPFYCSTGEGGKENVAAGKWYPFFGIANGWFNKLDQSNINNYYGSEKAKSVAQKLDSVLGDVVNLIGFLAFRSVRDDDMAVSAINQDLKPAYPKTPETIEEFKNNVRNVISKIGGKLLTVSGPIKGKLTLTHDGKNVLGGINISADFGRSLIKSDDAKYFSSEQFQLQKQKDNTWKLIHNKAATNITTIDGKEVTEPTTLVKGMVIALGKTGKFPMKVG